MKINLSNGTAYLALNKTGKSKDTFPIDSTVLLLNRLKGPIGFEILQESNAYEWLETWRESSPVAFEKFIEKLRTSDKLQYQDGRYFLIGNSKKDIALFNCQLIKIQMLY